VPPFLQKKYKRKMYLMQISGGYFGTYFHMKHTISKMETSMGTRDVTCKITTPVCINMDR
jgi:hypothetical protein